MRGCFSIDTGLTPLQVGQERYVLCSVTDMTQRLRIETERERLLQQVQSMNHDLEQRVADRTSALAAALRERDVLLQEIHHRVKNNLQVIASLIHLQTQKLAEGDGRTALEECMTRVQAIAIIHEKLYQSSDYANVPFSAYARSLVENIFRTAGATGERVTLAMTVDEVAVPVDKAIPCGLLLNELITNALKHAFPNGRRGQVSVELRRVDGHVRLVVHDDGVGLPDNTDIKRLESLGLRLVTTLARQLDASLKMENRDGARFEIEFVMEERRAE